MKEGDIDGLTQIYSHSIGSWSKISDVPLLKEAMAKICKEEEAAEEALRASSDVTPSEAAFEPASFNASDESAEINPNSVNISTSNSSKAIKKSFIADDGKCYKWDDEENDWVEDNDMNESDDDAEEDIIQTAAEEDDTTEKGKLPKRKRKKNKSKAPKNWVYITGLPANITLAELKDHFSKVLKCVLFNISVCDNNMLFSM
jgi:hypothetical protein